MRWRYDTGPQAFGQPDKAGETTQNHKTPNTKHADLRDEHVDRAPQRRRDGALEAAQQREQRARRGAVVGDRRRDRGQHDDLEVRLRGGRDVGGGARRLEHAAYPLVDKRAPRLRTAGARDRAKAAHAQHGAKRAARGAGDAAAGDAAAGAEAGAAELGCVLDAVLDKPFCVLLFCICCLVCLLLGGFELRYDMARSARKGQPHLASCSSRHPGCAPLPLPPAARAARAAADAAPPAPPPPGAQWKSMRAWRGACAGADRRCTRAAASRWRPMRCSTSATLSSGVARRSVLLFVWLFFSARGEEERGRVRGCGRRDLHDRGPLPPTPTNTQNTQLHTPTNTHQHTQLHTHEKAHLSPERRLEPRELLRRVGP